MKKWEYREIRVEDREFWGTNICDNANRLGQEGWELVSVCYFTNSPGWCTAIFKREILEVAKVIVEDENFPETFEQNRLELENFDEMGVFPQQVPTQSGSLQALWDKSDPHPL